MHPIAFCPYTDNGLLCSREFSVVGFVFQYLIRRQVFAWHNLLVTGLTQGPGTISHGVFIHISRTVGSLSYHHEGGPNTTVSNGFLM
jgi:hypothetical protein